MRELFGAAEQGFTMVEMFVTILILAILAAIAVPSFQTAIANAAIKGTAESIYQGLQIARSEAVRQNVKARLVVASDTSWSVVAETSSTAPPVQSKLAGEGSGGGITLTFTPDSARTVTFNALGRATANTDASAQLTTIDISGSGTTTARRIVIGLGAILCDPNAPSGDPKACP